MIEFEECWQSMSAGLRALTDKPEETPRSTLAALWHLAAGRHVSAVLAERTPCPALDPAGEQQLKSLLARRLAGEPLAHITGRQNFMGLEFLAGTGALIPRRETELLAERAIELGRSMLQTRASITIIDVCTGSGNVALALAATLPDARIFASDLSAEAIDLARQNATALGLADRVEFRTGDLLAPFGEAGFQGTVDLITCNPPYISTGKLSQMEQEIASFEPSLAFDGGPFGVRILQRLVNEAPLLLRQGASLVFEVGAGQAGPVSKRLASIHSYCGIESFADASGQARVVAAKILEARK